MAALVETAAEAKVTLAIEGRYSTAAREERQSAKVASREALKPSVSHVGWSSRPTNADRRRDARRAAEDAARAARLTDEDVELRRILADRDHQHRFKRHSTPATMQAASDEADCVVARTRSGALARLFTSGAIDAHQLASAIDIAGAAERIGADVAVRTASLETRVDAGRHGGDRAWEALGTVRREVAYRDWSRRLGSRAAPVLEMVVGEAVSYKVVAKRWRMGEARTRRLLIEALDLWPSCYADARREVDPASLAAAQAGLI